MCSTACPWFEAATFCLVFVLGSLATLHFDRYRKKSTLRRTLELVEKAKETRAKE